MKMTTLTWRPINRINYTLTSDRLFTKFRNFWLLVEDVFLTLNNHILKGYCLSLVKTLSFALTLASAPQFCTVFMVLWLPNMEFVSVLIAEFSTFMFYLEGLLICIHCTINCEDTLAKHSFQCSRLIPYHSFLSSRYVKKGKDQFERKCKTLTFSSKPCF